MRPGEFGSTIKNRSSSKADCGFDQADLDLMTAVVTG
jgi:hypothetical protein